VERAAEINLACNYNLPLGEVCSPANPPTGLHISSPISDYYPMGRSILDLLLLLARWDPPPPRPPTLSICVHYAVAMHCDAVLHCYLNEGHIATILGKVCTYFKVVFKDV
jgi:hypothetical protein